MLLRMKIAALAKAVAVALTLVAPAAAQLVQPWEPIITPSDRALLDASTDRLVADVTQGAAAGTPYGIMVPALLALVRAPAQPVSERDMIGDWRCRSIQVQPLGIFGYPFFRCRVQRRGDDLFFEKLTGSQRVSGLLFARDASAFVLLGGATVNNDPQRRYVGDTNETPDILQHNRAGLVTRIGAARLRIVFPADDGVFEVYELIR
jgi:hypothetical protein